MEPVRVLQVFTILDRGGAETMIMNYYRHIDRSRVQFDFLVHREQEGAYEAEIKKLGGRIYRMPPVRPGYFHVYKKRIKEFLKEHREYKIIHGHFSELGYFLYKEASRQHVPVIICHAHNSRMRLDLKAPFRWYFKHRQKKYITQPFTCSKDSATWLFGRKMGGKAIQMNNAIDTRKFEYQKDQALKLRKEMGLEGKIVLGHVGRFNEQKNHRFLIRMFAELKKEVKEAVLLLVGTGTLEEKVRKQAEKLGIKESVIFLGSRSDVSRLLGVFDFFVFPSLFEGLPVTVIEAQASGVRCFISDRISTDVDMGLQIVDYLSINDTKLWVNKIKQAAFKIEKIRASRHSGLAKIRQKGYDIEAEAEKVQQFYINAKGKE